MNELGRVFDNGSTASSGDNHRTHWDFWISHPLDLSIFGWPWTEWTWVVMDMDPSLAECTKGGNYENI